MSNKNKKEAGLSRRGFFKTLGITTAGVGASAFAAQLVGVGTIGGALPALAASGKPAIDTPTMTCTRGTDYIDITVTAGSTGLPAGFSLQWMTCDAYNTYAGAKDAFGWPVEDVDPVTGATIVCKAAFSGNASLSRYNLLANESVTVRVGEFQLDNGASTNCAERLTCGTCYVFRAWGNAAKKLQRSAFTNNLLCSTLACSSSCDPCVKSFVYWKANGLAFPADVIANGMTVGCHLYTALDLSAILNTNPGGGVQCKCGPGNGLISLAHMVITTKLNLLCNGVSAAYIAAVTTDLDSAEALMCNAGGPVPTVGGFPAPAGYGYLDPNQTNTLTFALDTTRSLFECPVVTPG